MSCSSITLEARIFVLLWGTFDWFLQWCLYCLGLGYWKYICPTLLVEMYCLKFITSHAYNRNWIDMLSSCNLKPLKTIAVPQYCCLRQICEPEVEVPHNERSLSYLNTLLVFAISWSSSSFLVWQNLFLLPELPVPSPTGSSLSHHKLQSLCATLSCSPMQQNHLHCSQNLPLAII